MWLWRCSCGNETLRCPSKVRRGILQSCGCQLNYRLDFTGLKWGRLTAVEPVAGARCAEWVWRCDCGNLREYTPNRVYKGNVVSCGCHKAQQSSVAAKARNKSGHTSRVRNARTQSPLWRIINQIAKPAKAKSRWDHRVITQGETHEPGATKEIKGVAATTLEARSHEPLGKRTVQSNGPIDAASRRN